MEDNLTRFIIKDKKLLIDIDIVKKELYIDYCYEDGIGFKKAILKQIDYETAQEISEYFKIDLEEYGVVINNSDESKMDDAQEKYLKKDDFEIRVFMILTIFSLISALYFGVEYMDTEMREYFGFLVLSLFILIPVVISLIFVFSRKLISIDEIANDILYKIKKLYL